MRIRSRRLTGGLLSLVLGASAAGADDGRLPGDGQAEPARRPAYVAQAPAPPTTDPSRSQGRPAQVAPGATPAQRTPPATTPGTTAQPTQPAPPAPPPTTPSSTAPATPLTGSLLSAAPMPGAASAIAGAAAGPVYGTLASASTGGIPQMIGDLPPVNFHATAGSVGLPPLPPTQPGGPTGQPPTSLPPVNRHPVQPIFRITAPTLAVKISENQSPIPLDRVFGQFNFYGSVNNSYNNRVSPQIGNVQAYLQLYGFEKTFLDGQASLGLRQTVDSVNVDSRGPQVPGGMFTSFGNMDVFAKFILLADDSYRNILTGGLDISLPTGPASFGGYPNAVAFRDTHIQPFVGFLLTRDRLFLQGFSSISAATDPNDVSWYFNDVGIGYYLYRADDPGDFVTSIVPTFETHVNTPLNHSGFRAADPSSQPDSVNLTFGTTFILSRRLYLTFSYTTPTTGPKPFEGELTMQLNFRFGGLFGNQPMLSVTPPPSL